MWLSKVGGTPPLCIEYPNFWFQLARQMGRQISFSYALRMVDTEDKL